MGHDRPDILADDEDDGRYPPMGRERTQERPSLRGLAPRGEKGLRLTRVDEEGVHPSHHPGFFFLSLFRFLFYFGDSNPSRPARSKDDSAVSKCESCCVVIVCCRFLCVRYPLYCTSYNSNFVDSIVFI